MKSKTARAIAPSGIPWSVLRGALISVGIMIAGTALMSYLIVMEILKESAIGYSAMGILLVSTMVGSMAATRNYQTKKLMISALAGSMYLLLLLTGNALLYKGGYEGVGVTVALVIGGSIAASFLGNEAGKRRYPSKRKKKHR